MKKVFKTLAMVLALVMVITMFVPMTESVQAAQAKLNYSKKTIYIGDSLKLKVKGANKKVKWSSSKKNVASVNSKGVVKGKDVGKVIIIANVGGKKLTCKVTVREKSKVTYINNRSVEYNNDDGVYRFFFGLLDQNENAISGKGTVDLRIENDGDVVYDKSIKYTKADFSTWSWYSGTVKKYVCCIEISKDQVREGKNTSGKLYYTVHDKDAEFDEYSLKINNLPKEKRKVEVDTNSCISDQYASLNKAQIISYNINDDDEIFLTLKITQIGDKKWTSFSTTLYEYDKNGNILEDRFVFDNDIYVGKIFVEEFYLKDGTVKIGTGVSSNNNSSNNNTKPTTRSVSENITLLKQYIKTNGSTNTNGEKFISDTTSGQTSSIVYSEQTGELKFVTASSDSGLIMTMSSANNSSSMQANYVLSSGGVGILATGYVNPSTYSLGSSVRFSITNATGGLTDDDIQNVCNSELQVGFTGWQVILYGELMMELKDIGFTAYK